MSESLNDIVSRIVLDHQLADEQKIEEALGLQRKILDSDGRKESLERVLVDMGVLRGKQLKGLRYAILYYLIRKVDRFYGKIAVQSDICEQGWVDEALKEQKRAHQKERRLVRINKILIEKQYINKAEDKAITKAIEDIRGKRRRKKGGADEEAELDDLSASARRRIAAAKDDALDADPDAVDAIRSGLDEELDLDDVSEDDIENLDEVSDMTDTVPTVADELSDPADEEVLTKSSDEALEEDSGLDELDEAGLEDSVPAKAAKSSAKGSASDDLEDYAAGLEDSEPAAKSTAKKPSKPVKAPTSSARGKAAADDDVDDVDDVDDLPEDELESFEDELEEPSDDEDDLPEDELESYEDEIEDSQPAATSGRRPKAKGAKADPKPSARSKAVVEDDDEDDDDLDAEDLPDDEEDLPEADSDTDDLEELEEDDDDELEEDAAPKKGVKDAKGAKAGKDVKEVKGAASKKQSKVEEPEADEEEPVDEPEEEPAEPAEKAAKKGSGINKAPLPGKTAKLDPEKLSALKSKAPKPRKPKRW